MSSEFIYSTTFRLKRGVEEDEKIKRILENYDKEKYRSVNNLIKKAILEFYAIEKQAASISKDDIADIIKEAVNDALSASNIVSAREAEEVPSDQDEKHPEDKESFAEQLEEQEQIGDEVLSFLSTFDDLYED